MKVDLDIRTYIQLDLYLMKELARSRELLKKSKKSDQVQFYVDECGFYYRELCKVRKALNLNPPEKELAQ